VENIPRVYGLWGFRAESDKLNVSPEAGVAQLVEQLIRNQQVIGSSPIAGSSFFLANLITHDRALARAAMGKPVNDWLIFIHG
jgi:hypothetical protein